MHSQIKESAGARLRVGRPKNRQEAARILDAAVEYVQRHGLAAFRLRALAQQAGTTHRMVIHYFGSKDGLLGEVYFRLRESEIAHMSDTDTRTLSEAATQLWDYYGADDANSEVRRHLFFYLVGQAASQPAEFAHFLEFTGAWQRFMADIGTRQGLPRTEAELRARQLMAGLRGLLLELAVTHDREACDAAARSLIYTVCGAPDDTSRGAP